MRETTNEKRQEKNMQIGVCHHVLLEENLLHNSRRYTFVQTCCEQNPPHKGILLLSFSFIFFLVCQTVALLRAPSTNTAAVGDTRHPSAL